MDKYFAKITGFILLLIAVCIVADLTQGIPAGGILNLITQFAPLNLSAITWAQIGSFFLAMFLLFFALRVLRNKKRQPQKLSRKPQALSRKNNKQFKGSREYFI